MVSDVEVETETLLSKRRYPRAHTHTNCHDHRRRRCGEMVLVADLTCLDAENCAEAATSVPKVASFDPAPVVAEHVARVPVLRLL